MGWWIWGLTFLCLLVGLWLIFRPYKNLPALAPVGRIETDGETYAVTARQFDDLNIPTDNWRKVGDFDSIQEAVVALWRFHSEFHEAKAIVNNMFAVIDRGNVRLVTFEEFGYKEKNS